LASSGLLPVMYQAHQWPLNKNYMTLGDAINGLGEQTEWLTVKSFILEQRDMCLVDFQDYTHVDNPQKLARLSGEIAGLTRIIESLENAETDTPSAI